MMMIEGGGGFILNTLRSVDSWCFDVYICRFSFFLSIQYLYFCLDVSHSYFFPLNYVSCELSNYCHDPFVMTGLVA